MCEHRERPCLWKCQEPWDVGGRGGSYKCDLCLFHTMISDPSSQIERQAMAAEVPFGPKQNFVMNSGMADLGQWNGKVTYRITAWLAGLENE